MRFHLLGVGSIGSIFATHLAALDATQVRLILRRKDLASQLLNRGADPSRSPRGTLKLERDGLVRTTGDFEMEMTREPTTDMSRLAGTAPSSNRRVPRIDPSVWLRNDPIETLIVTTKASQTLPALRHLLPRLSSRSTILLCQNGMGTLESLLERYWPEDRSDEIERERELDALNARGAEERWRVGMGGGGRPSFICATTTHGAWRKGGNHFVHAGLGDVKFGVLPNRAVLSAISNDPDPRRSDPGENPILNPRSLVDPTLDFLPVTPATENLHTTISTLLACTDLRATWLPLPSFETAQLQKLAVNASVNSLTALMGVNNGALIGSRKAKRLIETVSRECGQVFAAHLAREAGTWLPPSRIEDDDDDDMSNARVHHHPSPPPLPSQHPLSPESLVSHTLSVLFKTSSNVSSTLSDLLALQKPEFTLDNAPSFPSRTEINYINGYVAALGSRYGIETPVVRAMGDMVLLKEEMGRVGAIDRMWQGQQQASGDRIGETVPKGQRRRSIFSSPPSSSSGSEDNAESNKSRTVSRRRTPEPRKAHARAEKYEQIVRDSEDKARLREIERIQRDRGHDEGG
ncbi:hypothetical protein JCM3766R1_005623 [Sporobolomyces carnicolor]